MWNGLVSLLKMHCLNYLQNPVYIIMLIFTTQQMILTIVCLDIPQHLINTISR